MESGAVVFNPFDASWRADPYPLYRRLRAEAPIGQVPGMPIWYLSRYADCEAFLNHPHVSVESRNADLYQRMARAGIMRLPEDVGPGRGFLFLDPPDHTRLRRLVSRAFTSRVVRQMQGQIERTVEDLLDAAVARGGLEIVEDLAYPLPFTVISRLVGVPVEDLPRFRAWSKAMGGSLDPTITPHPEVVERQDRAMREASEYVLDLIEKRRAEPAEDLLSALIVVEDGGDQLSPDELLGTVILLLAAGQETTANLIANGTLALLRHPEQFEWLQREPGMGKWVVEETLRWDSPIQLTQRITLEDVRLDGVTIPARTPVVALIASANRDEAIVTDGERFDIGREEIRHIAFGLGPHYCLGAPLAWIEGTAAFAGLARRFPGMRLVERGVRRRGDLVLRGLEALHVEI